MGILRISEPQVVDSLDTYTRTLDWHSREACEVKHVLCFQRFHCFQFWYSEISVAKQANKKTELNSESFL